MNHQSVDLGRGGEHIIHIYIYTHILTYIYVCVYVDVDGDVCI